MCIICILTALLAVSCASAERIAPEFVYHDSSSFSGRQVEEIFSDTIVIATFNVRNLSVKTDTARLERIASLIERYDLSVLVEIRDTIVLERLICVLTGMTGGDYDVFSSGRVGQGQHWEYYGFIYDKSRISPKNFSGLYDDRYDSFARNPGYQAFKAGNFDFVVVAVHITWGSSVTARRMEINALSAVLAEIESMHEAQLGEPERDLLLLGDFNRPESDRRAFEPLRQATYGPVLSGDIKTTVGDVSAFDNILLRPHETREYIGEAGVDAFDIRLGLSRQEATNRFSDHRPVWAVFRISDPDDD
jgi:endonuclease/exonuclease/phosphatase family metal-dependent hydrolase